MPHITIQTTTEETILFEGEFKTKRACLEAAIADSINLSHANLKGLNLSNCNMDDALLDNADFTGSNLSGANLSESNLSGAKFKNTSLVDTCLSYSDLSSANFENARFGATDIVGTNLNTSIFSSLSCFSLNFALAGTMEKSSYRHFDNQSYPMTKPPQIIWGLIQTPIALLDRHILLGNRIFSTARFNAQHFFDLMIKVSMHKNMLT